MPYDDYIRQHPLFINHQNNREEYQCVKWKYEPFYILGKKVEQRVKEFLRLEREETIQTKKNRYTNDIEDYIPLDLIGPVNKIQKSNLRHIIEDLLGKSFWPYKSSENKVAGTFWNAALYFKSDETNEDQNPPEFSSMTFLNTVSKLCKYENFDDFIQRCFSKDLELDIVLLPFFCQDPLCSKLEKFLEHICKELNQCPEYNLHIQRISVEECKGITQFTNKDAARQGNDKMADLVIWGKMLSPTEVTVNLKILQRDMKFFGDTFVFKYDDFKISTFIGEFRIKLIQIFSWATAIRHFYKGNYITSISLLKELLDTGYEEIELNFRIAVLYDLMEHSVDASHYYQKTMKMVGAKGVINSFQKLIDLNFFKVIASLTTDQIITDGDYFKNDEVRDPKIMINEILKLMIFEIVRVRLAINFKDQLPKAVFERVLLKTINQVQPSWLRTEYKDLFGRAYFELGVINENRLKELGNIDPERVYGFYEKAALNLDILEEELHNKCIRFFRKYKRMSKIIQRMSLTMKEDDPALKKYRKSF